MDIVLITYCLTGLKPHFILLLILRVRNSGRILLSCSSLIHVVSAEAQGLEDHFQDGVFTHIARNSMALDPSLYMVSYSAGPLRVA